MKWQLAWIAFIPACVLVFGWFIYAELADLILARETTEGVAILAQGHHLLERLWPLIAAGVLGSAIPAWAFIVWMFTQLREEDHIDTQKRLETALTALDETKRQLTQAYAQTPVFTRDQSREWALDQREIALARREQTLKQREQQVEKIHQEAARHIEEAQTRAKEAELRAERATNAFQRVKRKALPKRPAQN